VQEAAGGADAAVRTSVLWPRSLPGAPADPDPHADPAAARQHLAACGHPDGVDTVMAVPDAPTSVAVGRAVAAQLAAVGIRAEVRPLPASDFYAKGVGDPDNVRKEGFGLVLTTRTADYPTPDAFLGPLVDGRAIRSVGNADVARLSDATVAGLVDRARGTTDAAAGQAAWLQVSAAAQATSAYVPLAEERVQLLAGQRLHGATVARPYNGYDLATVAVG
jgi:peptide/nickel transport system substrate-binding protein